MKKLFPFFVLGVASMAFVLALPEGVRAAMLQNPLQVSTICGLIKSLLNALLSIGVPVAVLFLARAGLMFVTARGNPTGLTKARNNATWTLVGIGIFLGAWLLGQIVANTVNSIATSTGNVAPVNQSCN